MKNYRFHLTGAFGDPIDENPTCVMMNAAYEAAGVNFRYLNFLVKQGALEDALNGIRAMHFDGVNLTMPHKVEALQYVDELSPSVALIGSTNTIVNQGGRLIAHNTDGQGFVEGMRRSGVSLAGKDLVLLGAGGAARAIAAECALAGAARIFILNRNASRGQSVAAMVNEKTACAAEYLPWTPGVAIPPCQILINATCVGMGSGEVPDIDYDSIRPGTIVQDIIPQHTAFLEKAKSMGLPAHDGFSMLVYQGAIAFQLWTGVAADTDVMFRALSAEAD